MLLPSCCRAAVVAMLLLLSRCICCRAAVSAVLLPYGCRATAVAALQLLAVLLLCWSCCHAKAVGRAAFMLLPCWSCCFRAERTHTGGS